MKDEEHQIGEPSGSNRRKIPVAFPINVFNELVRRAKDSGVGVSAIVSEIVEDRLYDDAVRAGNHDYQS